MPVDNQLYDRLGGTWWDEDALLGLLRTSLNPGRFGYMRRILTRELGVDPQGKTALDVGCGGGLLAEEFAALGFGVTGVDPSVESLRTARGHAEARGLEIDYVDGTGEHLPFDDASFDIVYCCDVLEHVDDLQRTLDESARVLKPSGVYMYDTINRTLRSKLVMIKLFQEWESTALMEPNLHDWDMFIKPRELVAALGRAGLDNQDLQGIGPARNPISMLRDMRRRVRSEMTYAEFGHRNRMREQRDRSLLYAGYAIKR
jgi:2-polyprenyl-6-hydroxyphenyl methylase/3-demethylubiquinone-9 3-methyltransferase